MKVYEVSNGYMGESYVRCYVLAKDDAEAIDLAHEAYKHTSQARYDTHYAVKEGLRADLVIDPEDENTPNYTEVYE